MIFVNMNGWNYIFYKSVFAETKEITYNIQIKKT